MDFSDFDDHDGEIVSEGPTSTVVRVESDLPDGPRFLAVKASTTVHAKEPHDIVKEVRLLAFLAHPNIVPLIKHELDQKSQSLSFWMPYIPYSLDELLQSSRFSPHPIISFGTIPSSTPREVQFTVLAKSIIFQILRGVSYLHSEPIQIAHRDIKPSNVLLTPSGRAQLIDFGISFPASEDGTAKARDLWPESAARMYFEVSTGPYRAPELLFGARTYDAFAIDGWSLGVTLSEFFTPLRLHTDEDKDEDEFDPARSDDAGSESSAEPPRPPTPPPTPFEIPRGAHTRPGMPTGRWTRTTLFDGTRGEIGLAWSIFKVCGTPTEYTWPSFRTLPDAGKLTFVHTDAVDLSTRLPNLPPSSLPSDSDRHPLDARTHAPAAHPVDLVRRFLVYEPVHRLRPAEALRHPWFAAATAGEPGLVLPTDDRCAESESGSELLPSFESCSTETRGTAVTATRTFVSQGTSRTLGDLLRLYVADKGDA